MPEFIFELGDALFNEETGEAVFNPKIVSKLIRCKDCKHQEVYCYETRGKKYFSYNCDLAENNSHVCLDDDFCSRGERRSDE